MMKMSKGASLTKTGVRGKVQTTVRHRSRKAIQTKAPRVIYELNEVLFNEMLQQVRMLIGLKGSCSEPELRRQFQNVSPVAVHNFLEGAIKQGIIKEEPPGTFVIKTH